MDAANRFLIFFGVFAAAFAVIYVFAMELNWAAFTYHPRLVEFELGAKPPRSGPAMYWYGWMTTSALGGLAAGGAAVAALSRTVPAKLWFALGWLVPAGAMLVSIYFMMPFFTR